MAFDSVEFSVAPARKTAARRGAADQDVLSPHKAARFIERTDSLYGLSPAIAATSLSATNTRSRRAKLVLADFASRLDYQAELLRLLQIPTRATMDAAEYLSDLFFVLSCAILDRLNLHLLLVADPLPMGAVSCSRLGMIVVQLAIDTAQHAFRQKRGVIGSISVALARQRNASSSTTVRQRQPTPSHQPLGRYAPVSSFRGAPFQGRLQLMHTRRKIRMA
jgi:hypothetical protein